MGSLYLGTAQHISGRSRVWFLGLAAVVSTIPRRRLPGSGPSGTRRTRGVRPQGGRRRCPSAQVAGRGHTVADGRRAVGFGRAHRSRHGAPEYASARERHAGSGRRCLISSAPGLRIMLDRIVAAHSRGGSSVTVTMYCGNPTTPPLSIRSSSIRPPRTSSVPALGRQFAECGDSRVLEGFFRRSSYPHDVLRVPNMRR